MAAWWWRGLPPLPQGVYLVRNLLNLDQEGLSYLLSVDTRLFGEYAKEEYLLSN